MGRGNDIRVGLISVVPVIRIIRTEFPPGVPVQPVLLAVACEPITLMLLPP